MNVLLQATRFARLARTERSEVCVHDTQVDMSRLTDEKDLLGLFAFGEHYQHFRGHVSRVEPLARQRRSGLPSDQKKFRTLMRVCTAFLVGPLVIELSNGTPQNNPGTRIPRAPRRARSYGLSTSPKPIVMTKCWSRDGRMTCLGC